MSSRTRPDDERDRGEPLSNSPKIKHFRAAKPPRERGPAPTRIGGGGPRATDSTPRAYRDARAPRAEGAQTTRRVEGMKGDNGRTERRTDGAPIDKRAARSAGGRPGAEPRAPRSDVSPRPQRPGKGPSGGRGHPPRAPRGGKK